MTKIYVSMGIAWIAWCAVPVFSQEKTDFINNWDTVNDFAYSLIHQMEKDKREADRVPIDEMLNSALLEFEYGSNDPTEQKVLLQFPIYGSEQSFGWRYN